MPTNSIQKCFGGDIESEPNALKKLAKPAMIRMRPITRMIAPPCPQSRADAGLIAELGWLARHRGENIALGVAADLEVRDRDARHGDCDERDDSLDPELPVLRACRRASARSRG